MGTDSMPLADSTSQQEDMENDMDDAMEDNIDFNDEEKNPYEADFDAGVEADEEEDPKRFIEQLSGKLSQSLRSYQKSLPKPDAATAKYAAGMVVKAAIENLSQSDVKDILDKISEDDNESDNETKQEHSVDNDEASNEAQQMTFDGKESNSRIGCNIDEIYNDITNPHINDETLQQRNPHNSYRKQPFVAPNFK